MSNVNEWRKRILLAVSTQKANIFVNFHFISVINESYNFVFIVTIASFEQCDEAGPNVHTLRTCLHNDRKLLMAMPRVQCNIHCSTSSANLLPVTSSTKILNLWLANVCINNENLNKQIFHNFKRRSASEWMLVECRRFDTAQKSNNNGSQGNIKRT